MAWHKAKEDSCVELHVALHQLGVQEAAAEERRGIKQNAQGTFLRQNRSARRCAPARGQHHGWGEQGQPANSKQQTGTATATQLDSTTRPPLSRSAFCGFGVWCERVTCTELKQLLTPSGRHGYCAHPQKLSEPVLVWTVYRQHP